MRFARPFVIAIDGPAASGKGTLAQRIAAFYGFPHLDTGALYRGVAWLMLVRDLDPHDAPAATRTAHAFTVAAIADADLRTPDVGRVASIVAAVPAVRAALLSYQRDFALSPPEAASGAVLDGRDIGTVVVPDAAVKLFVSATPEVRAARRWAELSAADPALTLPQVLADIQRRDARDAGRDVAPMRPAPDAVLIDTSSLDRDAVFARACRVIDAAMAGRPEPRA